MRTGVVVVGAGAIGLAVALQLRRSGVADVVVVDRNPSPGMGSTGRANGGVRAQFATPVNIVFSQYTIAGLIGLDSLTNGRVGYRAVGYLVMAGTEPTTFSASRRIRARSRIGMARPARKAGSR